MEGTPRAPEDPSRRSPDAEAMAPGDVVRWFLATDRPLVVTVREFGTSAIAVALVGLVLFAASGVWPPLVAVESGSMEPEMHAGDLVFVVEEGRLSGAAAEPRAGVVTARAGREAGYRRFGGPGDVIVYDPPGRDGSPIIHRALFWVEEGDRWADRLPDGPGPSSCSAIPHCPAPNAGFITKGDANPTADQVQGIARPVRPEWITGTAVLRFPGLGWVRLCLSGHERCPVRG
jgi:signal peptidase